MSASGAGRDGPSGRRAALRRAASSLATLAVLPGCATRPGPSAAGPGRDGPPRAALAADVLLIGEIHDNAAQHRLRLQWLDAIARHRRVALALEQLDAARQDDLDRARAADAGSADSLPLRARRLAEAAGFDFRGWDWRFYGPVIELALRRELPLIAANLSRSESVAVARGRAPAAPEPAGWGSEERRALEDAIRDGHCGTLPESMIAPMAAAQRTRDARMARSLVDARRRGGLPVVLLAGNGHVRRDIGVPSYLAGLLPQDRVFVIGMVESREGRSSAFDHAELTEAAVREDPCRALRAAMPPSRDAGDRTEPSPR
ncbi:MAG TPA: ChaN family lipoprotein [Burkholderiaceae bacterium]|nr:ChaN family lipoprotein [Burkholderiaceae bacterium]